MLTHARKSGSSELGKLHVYGDLLKLYTLPVHEMITKVGELYKELQDLERQLLTVYASYVLAHSNFYVELLTEEDYVEAAGKAEYTTKFTDDDWFEAACKGYFEPNEAEAFYIDWEMYYKNVQKERLKVIFATDFIQELHARKGKKLDEVQRLLKKFDKSCSNYVLVHPKLARQEKKRFIEVKEKMKQTIGQDLVLSTGEFVAKFIPNSDERYIIEENWNFLREKIVENLQKKWPFLIYATYAQQLSDAAEQIRKSRIKYETYYFEDAIKDAGIACESLLQILHSVYVSKKAAKELEFYDLLCALKEVLAEKFGSNIYQDLDFIRIWRNNVVHPGREKPDGAIPLQVITKAKLFHRLFKKKIMFE